MDEEYIDDLYNQLGGADKFGEYEDFKRLITSDDSYINDFHEAFGENVLGSFEDFNALVKKKRRISIYFRRGNYGIRYRRRDGSYWFIGIFRSRS